MTKEVNYTAADEAVIAQAVAANGGANAEVAEAVAEQIGKTKRSVIAKMVRMGLDYQRKASTKRAVARKDELVARIAANAGLQADAIASLSNATRADLEQLAQALAA